jgi:hypothetical protein
MLEIDITKERIESKGGLILAGKLAEIMGLIGNFPAIGSSCLYLTIGVISKLLIRGHYHVGSTLRFSYAEPANGRAKREQPVIRRLRFYITFSFILCNVDFW